MSLTMTAAGKYSRIALQGFIFVNALGTSIAPVLANPFLDTTSGLQGFSLADEDQRMTNVSDPGVFREDCNDLNVSGPCNGTIDGSSTHVQLSFVITAAILFATWIPFACINCHAFCCLKSSSFNSYKALTPDNEDETDKYLTGKRKIVCYTFSIVSVCCIYIIYFVSSGFIRTFSVDHFQINRDTASLINMCFQISCCLSPLLCIVISLYVSTKNTFLLFTFLLFLLVTVWFLSVVQRSLTLHWVGSALFPLTLTAIVNLFLSFCREHLGAGERLVSLAVFIRGLIDFVFVWLSGRLYDQFGSGVIYVILEPSALVAFVTAGIACLVCRSA